jgi:ABC-type nitrate/sulfonate/bicarbonate transport system permease component
MAMSRSASLARSMPLLPVIAILVLAIAWETFVRVGDVPRGLLPAPSAVLGSLASDTGTYLGHLWVTLAEVLLGFAAGVALGIALGLGIIYSRTFEAAVYPLVIASQVVPIFALAPLLVIWLGFGLEAKVVVIALGCFFPVTVNFVAGMRAGDPGMVALMRTFAAHELRILRSVRLPGTLPYLIPAAELSMTYAVIGAIVAEWIGSDRGMGKLMVVSNSVGRTEELFGAIALTTAVALLLFALVRVVGRRLTPWDLPQPT